MCAIAAIPRVGIGHDVRKGNATGWKRRQEIYGSISHVGLVRIDDPRGTPNNFAPCSSPAYSRNPLKDAYIDAEAVVLLVLTERQRRE